MTAAAAATPSIGPSVVVATAEPTVDPTADLVHAALAFASAAGYDPVPATTPTVDRRAAGYERSVLWHVSISIAGRTGPVSLDVYLDDARTVRVAEAELGFPVVSNGSTISGSEAIAEAKRALELAGIDPTSGDPAVWSSIPGQFWTLLLDREIDGHPVANHWADTGLAGDRVWVTLTGDGGIAELYAVRPPTGSPVPVLPTATLADRLAAVAKLAPAKLAALEPGLIWLRALDGDGVEAATLSLNYCATRTSSSGWESWCVDAATGERSAYGLGAD